uniref:Uncharacterized protein n=1 Tax=Anopheles albimanus TaxID=7167 RepID=A0A182F523_ANOAL
MRKGFSEAKMMWRMIDWWCGTEATELNHSVNCGKRLDCSPGAGVGSEGVMRETRPHRPMVTMVCRPTPPAPPDTALLDKGKMTTTTTTTTTVRIASNLVAVPELPRLRVRRRCAGPERLEY